MKNEIDYGPVVPELELFKKVEKVKVEEIEKLNTKVFKKRCPELCSEISPTYAEDEEDLIWDGPNVLNLNDSGLRRKINTKQVFNSVSDIKSKLPPQVYSFKKLTKEQQQDIYNNTAQTRPTLTHPKFSNMSTHDMFATLFPEENTSSVICYSELLPMLEERFEKLKFEWINGELTAIWKNDILDNNKVVIKKINIFSLDGITEAMTKITEDYDFIKSTLARTIIKELESVF